MSICLLTAHSSAHSTQLLLSEAQTRGLKLSVLNPLNMGWSSEADFNFALTLNRFSAVDAQDGFIFTLMRDKRLGRQVNSAAIRETFWDKTRQVLWMQQNNWPHLPVFSHRGPLTPAHDGWAKFRRLDRGHGWMLKVNRGQRGIGVHFLNNESELLSWCETLYRLGDQDFFIQPRIKPSAEYRVTFLNGEVWAWLKREPQTDKANFHQGGKALEVKRPPKNLEIWAEAALAVKADYLSIDILMEGETPYISDINTVPGFEQLEATTGRNFAANLLEVLLKSV